MENKQQSLLSLDDFNSQRLQIIVASNDEESATPLAGLDSKEFHPFRERKTHNPTTDCQTLTHLLKSTLGSGIMAMPYAFKKAGLIGGIIGGMLMAAACTHTAYILIKSAHVLYYRTRTTKMDYADVAEAAFATGPAWGRKLAKTARYFVLIWIFSTYFGACSSDMVLIATNYGQVYKHHAKETVLTNFTTMNATNFSKNAEEYVETSLKRYIMVGLIPVLILFIWVPDLKYLAPISTVANLFMACVLGITFYHLRDPLPIEEISLTKPISEFPTFFATFLFAMENIGVMLPLENEMQTPEHILGACGILNRGMFIITAIYILLGVLGYMKYGEGVKEIITTNLDVNDISAQVAKVLIGTTVLFTWSLQFYVCREMVWKSVRKYFPKKPRLAEYIVRAMLVVACASVAIIIPKIGPLVQLVGALGFSLLGLAAPVIIEVVTFWELGLGKYNWILYKAVVFVIIGFLGLYYGSKLAIEEIVKDWS